MAGTIRHSSAVWRLAGEQHGVVSRAQLLEMGFTSAGIEHRLERGRLHRVMRGIYALGRPDIPACGRWMAAVLSCGDHAHLSHRSAAALWGIAAQADGDVEVSITVASGLRRPGVRVHRRCGLGAECLTRHRGIPVTDVVQTLVDIAAVLPPHRLERAVNEADRLDLVDPDSLRRQLDSFRGQRGVGRLRTVLDRHTFRLTDSELERRFLAIVDSLGIERPLTQQQVNGYRVDFHWPALGLVVETDGLRYHRTPAQQSRDRRRDQAHTAAGLAQLRFTHEQVRREPAYVRRLLGDLVRRLEKGRRA